MPPQCSPRAKRICRKWGEAPENRQAPDGPERRSPVSVVTHRRKLLAHVASQSVKAYGVPYMGAKAKPAPRRSAASRPPPAAEEGAPDQSREVLNALRRIVRSLRVSSREAEQSVGLSGAQLFVLQCLSRQSPCSVNELASRTATDQSSVSVVVSRLVGRGYVARATSRRDRRSVELSLTPAGRKLLTTAPEAAQDRLLAALAQLKSTELSLLSQLLGRVVDLADVSAQQPSLFFEDGPELVRPKSPRRHAGK